MNKDYVLNKVDIKILMDKEAQSKDLHAEWGLAIFIRVH
jgi:hypothetical protein